MNCIPVIEVGGSHVCAAWVDVDSRRLAAPIRRTSLDPHRGAAAILDRFAECVHTLGDVSSIPLAVAIPGPFDYQRGVGRYRDVGKFDSLDGIDVGAQLRQRLAGPSRIVFLNDAAAFGLGEWLAGAARGYARTIAITLGTGVGSAFVDDGQLVCDGPRVPPSGHMHRTMLRGRPLEDVVSQRAIEAGWRLLADASEDDLSADIRRICELARAGHRRATIVLRDAFVDLGQALRPWVTRFRADLLVIGGGLTGAWDLIEGPLRDGLGMELAGLPVARSRDAHEAAAIGAAWHAAAERT